jgi:hypothetical protein
MDRKVWIVIAVLAVAAAGFFGFSAYKLSSQSKAGDATSEKMKRDLAAAEAREAEALRKAKQEEEARKLAELKAKQDAETEARRIAQAQSERQAQDQARERAEQESAKAAAELERMRGERAQLAAEAQRLAELRARESADAQAKLTAAQRALEESERKKNAEIERQAAVIASYSRTPAPSDRAAESPQASRRSSVRIVFPSDYKRANHYYLPLLPGHEKEKSE